MLAADDSHYPANICQINIIRPLEELMPGQDIDANTASYAIREPAHLADQGLATMLELSKDLVLSNETLESLFEVIAKIATQEPQQHQPAPEIPEDATEEQKEAIQAQINDTKTVNDAIDAENAKLDKIKKKVSINVKQNENVEENKEIALIKLNNFRAEVATNETAASKDPKLAPKDAQPKPAAEGEKPADHQSEDH